VVNTYEVVAKLSINARKRGDVSVQRAWEDHLIRNADRIIAERYRSEPDWMWEEDHHV
jgi:hypothetical protein